MDGTDYLESDESREALLHTYQQDLFQRTIPFWFPRAIDLKYGGFLHCFNHDGSLLDTDKSVWAQGRMSWMLLTLYNTAMQHADWLEWGTHGVHFLNEHCFDSDGRMFFHVTRKGLPIRKRRYAYSEAFASMAYSAHYKATGSESSQLKSHQLFDHFTDWNFMPERMPAKFTQVRPSVSITPRMITIVMAQELRANLGEHPKWNRWIDQCIEEIEHLFVHRERRAVLESVSPDGSVLDHFDGRLLNPGHAIEAAWFLMLEGHLRSKREWIELGAEMTEWMLERGWDPTFGGLYYFCDIDGKPVQEYWHFMKFWWPHNEAIIATLLARLLTGRKEFSLWHQRLHDWSFQHFADPKYGEWFGYLMRDGQPSSSIKGNMWKSFFHFPRMEWACCQLLKSFHQGKMSLH